MKMKSFLSFRTFLIGLTILTAATAFFLYQFGGVTQSYKIAILVGGFIGVLGLVLVFLKKRLGVFLYPSILFVSIVLLTEENLIETVSLMFLLFLFLGYGLVFIIPDWKNYS